MIVTKIDIPIKEIFTKEVIIPKVNLEDFVLEHEKEFAIYKKANSFLMRNTKYDIFEFTDKAFPSSGRFTPGSGLFMTVVEAIEDILFEDVIYFIKKQPRSNPGREIVFPHAKGLAIAWLTSQKELLEMGKVGKKIYGFDEEKFLHPDRTSSIHNYEESPLYCVPYLSQSHKDYTKFGFNIDFGVGPKKYWYVRKGEILLFFS